MTTLHALSHGYVNLFASTTHVGITKRWSQDHALELELGSTSSALDAFSKCAITTLTALNVYRHVLNVLPARP